jgi:Ca-activated chloride channel family protein
MKRIVVVTVVGSALLFGRWSSPALAVVPDEATRSPYFRVEGGVPGHETFPLESTRVSAVVSGVIASVTVKQVYRNTGPTPLHARYVFPASTRAAVHGLTLRVGDKVVVARIKEREEASREFEAAQREGKTASKLDQERPNVFTMSVANVLPKDRVEVELAYTELLVPTEGVYQFVYPTVVGPRYAGGGPAGEVVGDAAWMAAPRLPAGLPTQASFDIDVVLSTGLPLGDVRSPSHPITLSHEGSSVARVALAKPDGRAGNRDFILDYRVSGPTIGTGLMLYDNFFLLMVQPPAAVQAAEIVPREYIFVLDVSGSMNGFPLDTAKQVLRDLIGHLRPTDTFNVVLFSGASRLMAPASLPATAANIDRAVGVIERERGGGGTELEGALRIAMALPRRSHVARTLAVITDGYIAQEPGAFAMVHENLHDTNLFAFGIGASVNRHLIEGLARAGQGEPFVVTDPSEAAATGARFRRMVEAPVLTNIQVKAEGFDIFDVEPTVQPDLFAERPILVYGKWRGPHNGRIVVSGQAATGKFRSVIRADDQSMRPENAALPRLWARARIARLSDLSFDFDAPHDEAIREVTKLGLTYSLVTNYTSFIAVLEEVRNRGGAARQVDQPLAMPQGVSEVEEEEDCGAYGSGAEPELWMLAVGLAVVGALTLAFRRRHA